MGVGNIVLASALVCIVLGIIAVIQSRLQAALYHFFKILYALNSFEVHIEFLVELIIYSKIDEWVMVRASFYYHVCCEGCNNDKYQTNNIQQQEIGKTLKILTATGIDSVCSKIYRRLIKLPNESLN